jgi:hypothetical protein
VPTLWQVNLRGSRCRDGPLDLSPTRSALEGVPLTSFAIHSLHWFLEAGVANEMRVALCPRSIVRPGDSECLNRTYLARRWQGCSQAGVW